MMSYIDVGMVGRRLGFSFVILFKACQKKISSKLSIWWHLEKQKEIMSKFVIFILFVWAIMIIAYLAGWVATPPTTLLMETFFLKG